MSEKEKNPDTSPAAPSVAGSPSQPAGYSKPSVQLYYPPKPAPADRSWLYIAGAAVVGMLVAALASFSILPMLLLGAALAGGTYAYTQYTKQPATSSSGADAPEAGPVTGGPSHPGPDANVPPSPDQSIVPVQLEDALRAAPKASGAPASNVPTDVSRDSSLPPPLPVGAPKAPENHCIMPD